MTKPLRVDLLDVSHWNPGYNAAAAKRAGVLGVYAKITEGSTHVDRMYKTHLSSSRKAGLKVGHYHFLNANRSAFAQAKHFLKYADIRPGDLVPMVDVEEAAFASWSRERLTRFVERFCKVVEKEVGVKPLVYTQYDYSRPVGSGLWVARYSNVNAAPRIPAPWKSATVRQFSDGQYGVPKRLSTLPGVPLDLNTVYNRKKFFKEYTVKPVEHHGDC